MTKNAVMDNDVAAVAQRQLAACNAHDIDAFVACFSEDIVFIRLPNNTYIQGRDALRRHYGPLLADSRRTLRVPNRIVIGTYVMDHEYVGTGETTREREVAAMYRVARGLITHVWIGDER